MFDSEFLQQASVLLKNFLINRGFDAGIAAQLNALTGFVVSLLALYLFDRILRKIIIRGFRAFSDRTITSFDDFLADSNFPKYTAHIVPFVFFEKLIPLIFQDFEGLKGFFLKVTDVYLIILIVWILRSIIKSTKNYLGTKSYFKDKPLESYSQIIIIFLWAIGALFAFSVLAEQDIVQFLATLGAASAIILLMFKDTILGFVASIQVSVNDMVRLGDWITMEKYGADGDVFEINLTTVKVQNFDNTITTIPTYALISDSFKNWRGMQESQGRRIKRALNIKASSVRFMDKTDLEALERIQGIKNYIQTRQKDIDRFNEEYGHDKSIPINGRNQTNLGIFRKYCDHYLQHHPAVHKEMLLMTRILPITPEGIPLELYAFSSDKRWENYERIQADILEHLLASVKYFGLELYEKPSGSDLKALKS